MENAQTQAGTTAAAAPTRIERLKGRDYYLAIDKSGSMGSHSDTPTGRTRWAYAQESTIAISRKLNEYDPDGISVVPFASKAKLYPNTTPETVDKVFAENEPGGSTNLADALQVCFTDYLTTKAAGKAKPHGAMAVVITDGEPDNEEAVAKAIVNFTKKLTSREEFGISFIQVGQDTQARDYLKRLDDHLEQEGAKFDIVNTVTMAEIEDRPMVDVLIAALEE